MILLAIEQSSDTGSLALLQDDATRAERTWLDCRFHNQQVFQQLLDMRSAHPFDLAQIDLIAVGVGPGSYTGLRTAIAASQSLALPDHRQIYGVSSAETLAWQVAREFGDQPVIVVGDARRHQFWSQTFEIEQGLPVTRAAICLMKPQDLSAPAGTVVVSADWDRIGGQLLPLAASGAHVITEKRVPRAECLARLALEKIRRNRPSAPLAPLYLHAAVEDRK